MFFFESARESSVSFLAIEHCSIKNLLNISVKSKRNLSWRNKGKIQGTFLLFLRVFNMIIWLYMISTVFDLYEDPTSY